jgi:hypothetical protein
MGLLPVETGHPQFGSRPKKEARRMPGHGRAESRFR